jgi:hypothetical protein
LFIGHIRQTALTLRIFGVGKLGNSQGTLSDWSKAVSAKLAISLLPSLIKNIYSVPDDKTDQRAKSANSNLKVLLYIPLFYAFQPCPSTHTDTR